MGLTNQDWETPCPAREDNLHCNCWYDGDECCACKAPALTEMEKITQNTIGEHPLWG